MGPAGVSVRVRFDDMHLERPPKIRLFFDLHLENGSGQPQWVLLPDRLPHTMGAARQVHALEVYLLGASGEVVVGHLIGARGCQALLLPAGAGLHLRRFPVLYWGYEIPAQVTLEAVSGTALRIGDERAADWFPPDLASGPCSAAEADVDASSLADQMAVQFSRHTVEDQDLPLGLDARARVEIVVAIPN
jgi:hypothetical protein